MGRGPKSAVHDVSGTCRSHRGGDRRDLGDGAATDHQLMTSSYSTFAALLHFLCRLATASTTGTGYRAIDWQYLQRRPDACKCMLSM